MTSAFIEAAYRFDLSEREHLRELAHAGAASFGARAEVAAIAFRHVSDDATDQHAEVGRGDERILLTLGRGARMLTPTERHKSVQMQPAYESCSTLFGPDGMVLAGFKRDGYEDLAGLICPSGPQAGIAICAAHPALKKVRPNERRYYHAAALHVASGWRLRRALADGHAVADAVLRPDGHPIHLSPALASRSARTRLRDIVRRRERSRARARAQDTESAGFPALLAGTWTLADRFESDGRRYVIAYRVAADAGAGLLADDARKALALAVQGAANKVIALELGVSAPTVTRLLARALEALRLTDLREAMVLANNEPDCILDSDPQLCCWRLSLAGPERLRELTAAERDVVERLAAGASRTTVARERGTSVATVDSQIAAIYAKLRVGNKRGLLRWSVPGAAF